MENKNNVTVTANEQLERNRKLYGYLKYKKDSEGVVTDEKATEYRKELVVGYFKAIEVSDDTLKNLRGAFSNAAKFADDKELSNAFRFFNALLGDTLKTGATPLKFARMNMRNTLEFFRVNGIDSAVVRVFKNEAYARLEDLGAIPKWEEKSKPNAKGKKTSKANRQFSDAELTAAIERLQKKWHA